MCQIYCNVCKKPIENDDKVIEVRQGYVERGDFTPEEIFHYHTECSPFQDLTENHQ